MRPSIVLDLKRSAIREAAGRFRTANPRIFGSVLHGTDQEGSALIYWSMRCPAPHCSIWAACKLNWNRYSASMSIC